MRATCSLLKNNGISLVGKLIIINATKGIEKTLLRMSEIIDVFGGVYGNVVVLSGGSSHTEGRSMQKILSLIVAATNLKTTKIPDIFYE